MCVTKLLLASECRMGDVPIRSLVSGNTERSLYQVLRGAPRGVRRSVDREYAGRNATSVKESSPDKHPIPWWPSQYEEAKATSVMQRAQRAAHWPDGNEQRRTIDTTGVQDHGMYTRYAAERERSAGCRANRRPLPKAGKQGLITEPTAIHRAEVRCAHSSETRRKAKEVG